MTDAARMVTCATCGGCRLKIGRASNEDPKLVPCPMCGHGQVESAPMDDTIVVHCFDSRGNHTGTLGAPDDNSGWKEEYGYPSPAELFKGERESW